MKSFIAAGALFAAAASAQSITDLPSCSLNCIATAVLSLCPSISDYACACKASAELNAQATPCVQKACTSTADQQKVITVLEGICANAGFPITITPPAASTSAAPVSSSAAPASSSAVVSSAVSSVISDASSAVSSAASSAASSGSVCTASTTYTTVTVKPTQPSSGPVYPTGASNATVTTALPTQYTGAAAANGVTFGAAGALGLLAYLL